MKTTTTGDPIEDVRYEVEIRDASSLGWRVRRARLAEALSEPYELEVELVAEQRDVSLDPRDLVGADVSLHLERNGFVRTLHGIIDQVSAAGFVSGHFVVISRAVPAWLYLKQHVDTRIFQDGTTPEILQAVLEPALQQYGRALDTSRLHEAYVVRDYCVQYAESIFDFASRLMEEEGICYYFRPEEVDGKPTGVELMILADQREGGPNADFDELEGIIDEEVHVIDDRPETADVESIQSIQWTRPDPANKVVMRRFNWKRPIPGQQPEAEQSFTAPRQRQREVYIPDDRRRVEDKAGDDAYEGTEVDEDEKPAVQRRFELLAASQDRGSGTSNLIGLRAGGIFTLADHVDDAIAGKRLLVTRVVCVGAPADAQPGTEAGTVPFYNSFACILADTPFRPPLKTPRPRIFGPQTAIVTGPPGEEIHTDRHGRIKIRFHWDRLSPYDETSSCWVRVAQTWAGPSWGTWFLPRVGMEVLVEFLDGNPDRPLVTGCVYNGANATPYPLPEDKTKSTIKTSSSPGGGGGNELRFEDAKGAEEIYLHAQKDLSEVVENSHSRTVKGSETISVGGDQSVTITGNRVVVVNGANGKAPKSPHYSITVNDDYSLAAAKTVLVTAEEKISFRCKTTLIELTPDKIVLQAGEEGSRIVLDVEALIHSKNAGWVHLDDKGNVSAKAKDEAWLSLTQAAVLASKPGAQVELTGEAKLAAAEGGADLLLNADATMQGNKVDLTSAGAQLELTTAAALSSAESALVQAPTLTCVGESVATVTGATVDVIGVSLTTVKGMAVKIN